MNGFIVLLLFFALLGAVDKILGGRWGLAEGFDQGLGRMGALCLSMMGIYCIGIMAIRNSASFWQETQQYLPFDASLLLGALLAPDMGGYAIAKEIAVNPNIAVFSGVLVSSTLGCTLSFLIPIFLGTLPSKEIPLVMEGLVRGVIVLPLALGVGLILLKMPWLGALHCLWPICLLCLLLFTCLRFFPQKTVRILSAFGELIRILSIVLFCVAAASVFFPQWNLVERGLLTEILEIVFRIAVAVSGSSVLSALILRWAKRPMSFVAQKLKVNEYAVVGLMLSLASSVAMLPLFSKMDRRGKLMNAAFSVSAAFVMGGQFVFIASMETSSVTTIFMLTKIIGGLAALLFTYKTIPTTEKTSL